jgi:hypothetical protein
MEQHALHDPEPGAVCSNCEAPLTGGWCSQCGQPRVTPNPTWHDLVHETIHEFLHLDGKIFATARRLFLQPGELTAEHIRGRRVRYIGALRLYLTMSIVFFALSAVIPNPDPNSDANPPAAQASGGTASGNAANETANAGTGVRSRIAKGIRRAGEHQEEVDEALSHTFQRMLFVLVPVFALLLKLAYRSRRRNYPQFLYFSLHFHAAVFGFLALTVPLQAIPSERPLKAAQALVLAVSFVYLVKALKRVFGGSTRHTLLRASALTATYLALLLGTTVIGILLALYRLGSSP